MLSIDGGGAGGGQAVSAIALAIALGGTVCALVLGIAALLLARERPRTAEIRSMLREANGPLEAALADLARSLETVRNGSVRASDPAGALDLDDVLGQTVDSARRLYRADAAGVVVESDDGSDPHVATSGLAPSVEVNPASLRLTGAGARAVTVDYRHVAAPAGEEGPLRSALAVPLQDARGEHVGTLSVFWRHEPRELADEDVEPLENLARRAAPVIARAILDLTPAVSIGG